MTHSKNGAARLFRRAAILLAARAWLVLRHARLVRQFRIKLGYWPDPAVPRTYHERMLWRKIFDRDPLFERLSDKLAAKEFLRARAPGLRVPATLWAGSRPEDIPAAYFAGGAMLKTNHASGIGIVPERDRRDRGEIVAELRRWLRKPFGRGAGEWAYQAIPRQVFAEELLALGGGELPTDIKVHVFGGRVGHVWLEDKQRCLSAVVDAGGNFVPGRDSDYPREEQALPVTERVAGLAREAVALALPIAGDSDYLRVDFLVTAAGLYAGEVTVYSGSGYGTWSNPAVMERAAQLWDLRQSWFMRQPHRGLAALYAEALRAEYEPDAAGGHEAGAALAAGRRR
jgi:hypothetical protein